MGMGIPALSEVVLLPARATLRGRPLSVLL